MSVRAPVLSTKPNKSNNSASTMSSIDENTTTTSTSTTATINGEQLSTRDGMGIWDTSSLEITASEDDAEILLMDVPMHLN